jgi:FSR family fosmidomycin resistance protein-like MFS transporter
VFRTLVLIGGNLGRGLAPLAAWFVFSLWGRPALLLLALPGLILALALHRYGREVGITSRAGSGDILASLRTNRGRLISLLVIVGSRSLVALPMLTFLPIYWHTRYGATSDTAFLLSIMLLVGSVGNFLGGYFSDLVGRATVLVVSALLSGLVPWLFVHAGTGFWVWILIGLLGITLYSTSSVTMVLGQQIFPQNKGMASGVALGVGNTLGAGGVGLVGLFAQRWGVPAALELLIPVVVLSIPFVYSFRQKAA